MEKVSKTWIGRAKQEKQCSTRDVTTYVWDRPRRYVRPNKLGEESSKRKSTRNCFIFWHDIVASEKSETTNVSDFSSSNIQQEISGFHSLLRL